jgi:hypothetical protein
MASAKPLTTGHLPARATFACSRAAPAFASMLLIS